MKIAAIICVVVAVISCSSATSVKFQFEDVPLTQAQQGQFLQDRTNAEIEKTFALVDEGGYSKSLSFWLCLVPETGSTTVDVQFKIRYSNQADIDTIRVYFDSTLVDEIKTKQTGGWNTFLWSKIIGSGTGKTTGDYRVTVDAKTGATGVELDSLECILTNQNPLNSPVGCQQPEYQEN